MFQWPKQWLDVHGALLRLLLAGEALGPGLLARVAHRLAAKLLEQTIRDVPQSEVRATGVGGQGW